MDLKPKGLTLTLLSGSLWKLWKWQDFGQGSCHQCISSQNFSRQVTKSKISALPVPLVLETVWQGNSLRQQTAIQSRRSTAPSPGSVGRWYMPGSAVAQFIVPSAETAAMQSGGTDVATVWTLPLPVALRRPYRQSYQQQPAMGPTSRGSAGWERTRVAICHGMAPCGMTSSSHRDKEAQSFSKSPYAMGMWSKCLSLSDRLMTHLSCS